MGHITAVYSQTNYRFRNDDGSESSATWKANQNTNITANVTNNFPFRFRVMVQETAGGSENNVDITLQYQKNGGTWTAVDGSTSNVVFRVTPNVANQTPTTQQLSGGSGTFSGGTFIDSNASAYRATYVGNDYIEMEYSVQVLAADVVSNDVFNFRVLKGGSTITYSQVPSVTVLNNTPPTVALDTASGANYNSASPTLEFTGTDAQSDDVRYNVQVDTVDTFDSQQAAMDSYSESNIDMLVGFEKFGQSFTGNGGDIGKVGFYVNEVNGSPTTNIVAKIYAHTGTFGTSSLPTGSALATSNTIDQSTVSSGEVLEFTFGTPYTTTSGTKYVVTFEIIGYDGANAVRGGVDYTSASHAGNIVKWMDGAWVASSNQDMSFVVYDASSSGGPPLLSKTSGTDSGFLNTVNSGDTDPFTSGQKVSYTVQNALADGTYYWRVRGLDPSGTNTYGAWSETGSFTIAAPPTVALNTTDAEAFSTGQPTVEFTGTDAQSDDLRYNVQVGYTSDLDAPIDSFPVQGTTGTSTLRSTYAYGQVFYVPNPIVLTKSSVYGFKEANFATDVNSYMEVYNITGTPNLDAVPIGSAIAISDNVSTANISTTASNIEYEFSGTNRITLNAGWYGISVTCPDGPNFGELVKVFRETSGTSTHHGNAIANFGDGWSAGAGQYDRFFAVYGQAIDSTSNTDPGFLNTVNSGDTDPFTSGQKVSYTVQAGDALGTGTYYWRVRGKDPSGSNLWGEWSETRSFTTEVNAPPTVALNTTGATTFTTGNPTLEFTASDAEGDDVRYDVEISSIGSATSTSFIFPTTHSSLFSQWSNPANALVDNGLYADGQAIQETGEPIGVRITNDSSYSAQKMTGNYGFADVSYTVGGTSDLWGLSLTAESLNSSNFNVVVQSSSGSQQSFGGFNLNIPAGASINGVRVLVRGNQDFNIQSIQFLQVSVTYTPQTVVVSATSNTDPGFLNTVNGADTDPFTSGQKVSYTVQAGDALTDGTYYWRVRGLDPSGSNTYGPWSEVKSFTVTTEGGEPTGYKLVYVGGSWVAKPVKVLDGGSWVTKPVKSLKAGSWTITN